MFKSRWLLVSSEKSNTAQNQYSYREINHFNIEMNQNYVPPQSSLYPPTQSNASQSQHASSMKTAAPQFVDTWILDLPKFQEQLRLAATSKKKPSSFDQIPWTQHDMKYRITFSLDQNLGHLSIYVKNEQELQKIRNFIIVQSNILKPEPPLQAENLSSPNQLSASDRMRAERLFRQLSIRFKYSILKQLFQLYKDKKNYLHQESMDTYLNSLNSNTTQFNQQFSQTPSSIHPTTDKQLTGFNLEIDPPFIQSQKDIDQQSHPPADDDPALLQTIVADQKRRQTQPKQTLDARNQPRRSLNQDNLAALSSDNPQASRSGLNDIPEIDNAADFEEQQKKSLTKQNAPEGSSQGTSQGTKKPLDDIIREKRQDSQQSCSQRPKPGETPVFQSLQNSIEMRMLYDEHGTTSHAQPHAQQLKQQPRANQEEFNFNLLLESVKGMKYTERGESRQNPGNAGNPGANQPAKSQGKGSGQFSQQKLALELSEIREE